jgi:hypothetical protein
MINTGGNELVGGAGGLGFGGFGGGGGIIEGLILGAILNRGRGGLFGGEGGDASLSADGIASKTALLVNQNADQNAILAGIANVKDNICDSEKTTLQQFYASAIQASNLAQSIKDQNTAFAIVADKRFDDLTLQSSQQTTAILSKIDQVENQSLRDQLFLERRRGDFKEHELNIVNTNTNVNNQFQQQQQRQDQRDFEHNRKFDALFNAFNQVNRTAQDIVNLGTMNASGTQATSATNIK